MLPELLFSVGSMQDISRDDFGLMSGGCEKDPNLNSGRDCMTLERIKLGRTPDHLEPVSIKIEEPDIYPWHTSTDIGSNLLCHSDDPLISGAIDDNQNEFNPIKNAKTNQPTTVAPKVAAIRFPIQLPGKSSNQSLVATETPSAVAARKKVPRTRRKGQFKLRFHHQALPQEYLEHYEATQNSQQKRDAAKALSKVNKIVPPTTPFTNHPTNHPSTSTMETNNNDQVQMSRTNESVRSWLQKISEYQCEASAGVMSASASSTQPTTKTSSPLLSVKHESESSVTAEPPSMPKKTQRVVSYSDLPYMGEMTLDNSKPRRGRKPKKADICHLIYKNYGTILPGTPRDMMEGNEKMMIQDQTNNAAAATLVRIDLNSSSELQSKLMESLLEKRLLTTEKKSSVVCTNAVSSIGSKQQSTPPETTSTRLQLTEEPLNLCVRDRSQETYTVMSSDEEEVESSSVFASSSRNTSRLPSPSDTDSVLANNLKMSLPNFQTAMMDQSPSAESFIESSSTGDSASNAPAGFGYWPSGTFIHPMALYYHKIVDAAGVGVVPNHQQLNMMSPPIPPSTPSTGRSSSTPAVSPMPFSSTSMPSPSPPINKREPTAKILIPKNISQLLKQQEKPASIRKRETSSATSEASSTCSSRSPSVSTTTPTPQKRKRSAIFIPPMPLESSTNHATEVSICKFKFTGGAKPSLQEKKMLSVDAGGNFRYYSGTGDKSMRGYEFFPRESLQQSSLMAGSSAGAFLNTPGEKITLDLSPPSLGLSNEILQIPDLPSPSSTVSAIPSHLLLTTNQPLLSLSNVPNNLLQPPLLLPSSSPLDAGAATASDRRKRKSRRSMQREKLEKTFKEKGFLIQTQQLESAEGATYCKFRQLRKFTRYLFRSWKDYLPGELQQHHAHPNDANGGGGAAIIDASQLLMSAPAGHQLVLDDDGGRDTALQHLNSIQQGGNNTSAMILDLPCSAAVSP